jgi:hypothetical protein
MLQKNAPGLVVGVLSSVNSEVSYAAVDPKALRVAETLEGWGLSNCYNQPQLANDDSFGRARHDRLYIFVTATWGQKSNSEFR